MRAQVLFSSGLCHSYQGLVVMTAVTENIWRTGERASVLLLTAGKGDKQGAWAPW